MKANASVKEIAGYVRLSRASMAAMTLISERQAVEGQATLTARQKLVWRATPRILGALHA